MPVGTFIFFQNNIIFLVLSLAYWTTYLQWEVITVFNNHEFSRTDLTILSIVSIGLTVPFIFYAKDIANSLRVIAESNIRRPLSQRRSFRTVR